jgi:hypothetical protein
MLKSTIYELAIASVIDNKELQTMTKTEIIDVLATEMHIQRMLEEEKLKKNAE